MILSLKVGQPDIEASWDHVAVSAMKYPYQKKIKPKSNQDSRHNHKFIGNAENREPRHVTLWGSNQPILKCEKFWWTNDPLSLICSTKKWRGNSLRIKKISDSHQKYAICGLYLDLDSAKPTVTWHFGDTWLKLNTDLVWDNDKEILLVFKYNDVEVISFSKSVRNDTLRISEIKW